MTNPHDKIDNRMLNIRNELITHIEDVCGDTTPYNMLNPVMDCILAHFENYIYILGDSNGRVVVNEKEDSERISTYWLDGHCTEFGNHE